MSRSVGRNVRRKDSDAKVTGAANYIDDLTFPGMLHGRTVRSTVPRGRINAIRLDFDTADFTAKEGPGHLRVDLVLPSADLQVAGSGVLWPPSTEASAA